MNKFAALLLLLVAGGLAPAQEKSKQLTPSVRLYEPKNMSAGRAQQVASFVNSLYGKDLQVGWEAAPNGIVIRNGTPAEQDAAEALLKRFDVPEVPQKALGLTEPSGFELAVYLIRASADQPPPSRMPIPKDLESAINEMKQSFAYRDYSLWDTILTPVSQGSMDLSGILPGGQASAVTVPNTYSLSYASSGVTAEKTLMLRGFAFTLQQGIVPSDPLSGMVKPVVELPSRIAHDVALHSGQKLVLGKIHMLRPDNTDLFLIMTARQK